MTRIGVIVGSTRPGRRGAAVARWVEQVALRHVAVTGGLATVEVIDLAQQALPMLDEPVPAMFADYRHLHTRRWSAVVAALDALVFVTPEYNHSIPAALKNAIDFLYAEWNGKAAAVVGYGVQGGSAAVGHLRQILAEVRALVVPTQVALSVFTDFDFSGFDPNDPTAAGVLTPGEGQAETLSTLLVELVSLSRALRRADPGLRPGLATEAEPAATGPAG